ncbi:MAG TPA: Sec-independent protein translocase protein TatB [Acetobacteraceae bacterium]|nr:Sec-independent protein translocase protein TatB [Acetobacteraceae bacterium]
MFDFAWSEIALIGVVALIAIGPKDMPGALKALSGGIKKARKMASEFQGHVDELVREADLHEVRDHINELRSFDLRGHVERAIDSDGSIRRTFEDDPFHPATPAAADAAAEIASDGALQTIAPPYEDAAWQAPLPATHPAGDAPAFIPPQLAVPPKPAPAFIPPDAARAAMRARRG